MQKDDGMKNVLVEKQSLITKMVSKNWNHVDLIGWRVTVNNS